MRTRLTVDSSSNHPCHAFLTHSLLDLCPRPLPMNETEKQEIRPRQTITAFLH